MQMPPLPFSQYESAYPTIHYKQPPGAANGYGWHGNGYGFQVDPKAWHTPPLYPSTADVAVEEPPLQQEKVEKVNAWIMANKNRDGEHLGPATEQREGRKNVVKRYKVLTHEPEEIEL